jgi:hypothetical protein
MLLDYWVRLCTSLTCGLRDEGVVGSVAPSPRPLLAWMFFVPNPGEYMTHWVRIYFL